MWSRNRVGCLGLLLLQTLVLPPLEGQVLVGRLLSTDGDRPLPLGTIRFLSLTGGVVTVDVADQEGWFSLEAPTPGEYLVRGEAAFHEALTEGPVALATGDTLTVEFRLRSRAVALDALEVEVEARRPNLVQAGFYDRRRQGFGHFLGEEEIDRRFAEYWMDLLRILPRVEVVGPPPPKVLFRRLGTILLGTGVCEPSIYVDGFLQSEGAAADIMPSDIGGIEVYTSPAMVPAEYQGGLTGCGVILIWTRR